MRPPAGDVLLKCIGDSGHTRFPVCRGGLDDVRGVLNAAICCNRCRAAETPVLAEHMLQSPRCSCPRPCRAWSCWRTSGAQRADLVFVVDEYGAVQGVITERDLLEAITGEFGNPTDADAWAVKREDGSWLLDGLIPCPS
jgi:putative hemolysin